MYIYMQKKLLYIPHINLYSTTYYCFLMKILIYSYILYNIILNDYYHQSVSLVPAVVRP